MSAPDTINISPFSHSALLKEIKPLVLAKIGPAICVPATGPQGKVYSLASREHNAFNKIVNNDFMLLKLLTILPNDLASHAPTTTPRHRRNTTVRPISD